MHTSKHSRAASSLRKDRRSKAQDQGQNNMSATTARAQQQAKRVWSKHTLQCQSTSYQQRICPSRPCILQNTHGLQAHGRSTVDPPPKTKRNTTCQPQLLEHNNKHEGCGASTHRYARAQAINKECVHLDHAYFTTRTGCKHMEEAPWIHRPRPRATQHVSHMWRRQQQA